MTRFTTDSIPGLRPIRLKSLLRTAAALAIAPLFAVACGSSDRLPSPVLTPPRAEQIPEKITVAGGTLVRGFSLGALRQEVPISSFSISRTPTTVGHYKECIASGSCTVPEFTGGVCATAANPLPEGKTFDPGSDHDELPVTCMSPRQAASYCVWLGGALPTLDQWLYAARGPSVQRFSWGQQSPTCELHPRATPTTQNDTGCCPGEGCSPATFYAVAQRPDRSSPSGLVDVLLTTAELLRGSKESAVPACGQEGVACAVQGILPGAIDFAAPASEPSPSDHGAASGFRCVFEVTR